MGGSSRLRLDKARPASDKSMLLKLTLSIFTLMVFASLVLSSTPSADLPRITSPDEYWRAVGSGGKVLMYFSQAACPGCKKIEPSIARFASEQSEVKVYKVDLDAIAEKYGYRGLIDFVSEMGVRGTPTLILYVNGREVARHEGTFGFGDQYEPLKRFVESSLQGDTENLSTGTVTTGLEVLARTTTPAQVTLTLLASLAFGLIAAVSPCSLPMVAAFATLSDESRRFRGFVATLASVAAVAFAGGSIFALIYVVGDALVPFISPGVLLIFAASAFIIAWGLMSLAGREPVIALSGRAKSLLPVIGLQCSLPFLIAVIALAGKAPHLALGASLLFAAGYGLPYALAASAGGEFMQRLTRYSGGRALQVLQGLLLIAAGLYFYWTLHSSLLKV
ncbi:MAG: thioredoxin domain-containing protein [Desulfurococcales archaeon]|nr:thioredoxin domain-containing protein [Desulfurococcales archaeon]